jgi:hypothetical protein
LSKTKRQRGLDFQRWIKNWLEERGWIVHNETPSAKKTKTKEGKKIWVSGKTDIFNCIDLIAKKDYRTLWIQATLDSSVGRKIEKLKTVPWAPNDEVFIFRKVNKEEVVIKRFSPIRQELDEVGRIRRRVFYPKEGRFEI